VQRTGFNTQYCAKRKRIGVRGRERGRSYAYKKNIRMME
jgi:hypothetical protein